MFGQNLSKTVKVINFLPSVAFLMLLSIDNIWMQIDWLVKLHDRHKWWRHGRQFDRKNGSTITATVFIPFSWNFEYNICSDLLDLGLYFSNLCHHLLVKMTAEKNVKTGSDVNSKTKYRFLLIFTRWTRIYAYRVYFTKTDCFNAMI